MGGIIPASKEALLDLIGASISALNTKQLFFRIAIAVLIALFIFVIYRLTYSGVAYSLNFNLTLMMTCIVTASIMMVINSNLSLSLGMVGALSIIRFRSAVKDPRDIGFLFWAVAGGLSTGTGFYEIAIILSAAMAALLLFFRFIPSKANSFMLVIRGDIANGADVRKLLTKELVKSYKLKVRNVTPAGSELIYEVELAKNAEDKLLEKLSSSLENASINLVAHTGDTTI